jgi:glycosyltransferase involved in cell wall biosynthesis
MKILYPLSEISPSYGGIGSYTYKIIHSLINNFNDYEAIILTSNQEKNDTFSKYFNGVDRVKVISLFEKNYRYIFVRDLHFQIALMRKIKKLIREEEIDIIHHQTGHYELFFPIHFLGDLPVIMTSHGDIFTLIEKWKKVELNTHDEKINYSVGKLLFQEEKILYEKSDKIIAVADHVRRNIINHYGIPSEKVVTIHNFVDPDVFYFHPGDFHKPYKIGFIGRPYFIKGFYDLIKILNNDSSHDVFEWHLVTDRNVAKKLFTNDGNIHFYGGIPQAKLSEFYDDIDFMFIPSYSEAGPTVVIESILKGKLCISRDIIGIREIMRDCSGYFFKDISQLRFPDIFQTFTKDPLQLLEILKDNREKIKKMYGSHDIIHDIYQVYKTYK